MIALSADAGEAIRGKQSIVFFIHTSSVSPAVVDCITGTGVGCRVTASFSPVVFVAHTHGSFFRYSI